GGDVIAEVARTHDLIRRHVPVSRFFFRAPYGNWRQKESGSNVDRDNSIVAQILNESGHFDQYIGPVNWEISAAEYDFGKRGDTAEKCALAYMDHIERIGRGIVLMHDSSEDPVVQPRNRAFETTRLLVHALRARGYRFVSLEEVPQVKAVMAVSFPD